VPGCIDYVDVVSPARADRCNQSRSSSIGW
jgi:hypothetical protein